MNFNVADYTNQLSNLDLTLRMPASEYESRIERVRAELARLNLDAAFAFGTEYRPGDTGWLTGYDPHIESTMVIVGPKKVLVLGSPDAMRYAREMIRAGEFRNLAASGIPDADYPDYEQVSLREAFVEACGHVAGDVALLTPPDVVTCQARQLLEESIDGKVVDHSETMADLRYRKSPLDLQMMRQAARLSTWGMDALIKSIQPGVREIEAAASADFVMKSKGADRFGFTTIVMSGSRVASNIGRATERVIEEGDLVVLGISARYEGLTSALGRTIVTGRPSADQAELINHARVAFEKGVAKLRCGKPARDMHLASSEYLRSVGLSQMYNIGHGIGWTEVFEKGIASQHSDYDLPAGIAIQMDVGIVGVPYKNLPADRVGLRIEDPYLIDHEGRTERMTGLEL